MARLGLESMISRSEVNRANHYSIGPLLENWQIYLFNIHCDETKSESWPVKVLVSVLPEYLILFYKQHMIKETSWMFLDFMQSLLIFVA